jgi:hypothetical protein
MICFVMLDTVGGGGDPGFASNCEIGKGSPLAVGPLQLFGLVLAGFLATLCPWLVAVVCMPGTCLYGQDGRTAMVASASVLGCRQCLGMMSCVWTAQKRGKPRALAPQLHCPQHQHQLRCKVDRWVYC